MKSKDTSFKVIAVMALLIAVVGLSIAYALFTSTLTIGGTATVESAWKVIWKDLNSGTATGYASVEGSTLAIDSNTHQSISGVIGTLKAPGDTITYTWKAANDGDINANLTGVTLGTLSCAPATGSNATAEQAAAVCNKLSVAFTYDGAALTSATTGALATGTSKDVTMVITYAAGDGVEIDGDVTVTLSTTSFTYEQANA